MTENRTFTRRFDTHPKSSVSWLWKPYIPMGKVTVIQGDPGDGKTTVALAIAAYVTTGRPLPETTGEPVIGEVIYQSAEDNVGDTLNPRLLALGADCSKISYMHEFSDIEKDCENLENAILEVEAKFVCLDPLQAYIGRGRDMSRAADMRRLMSGLAEAAERTQCAIIAIGHMNKTSGAKKLYRGLGPIDIAASARSVLLLGRSAEDKDIRVMSHVKSSLAQEGAPIAFTIGENSSVEFLGPFDGDIRPLDAPVEENKRESAAEIILEMTADEPRRCSEIYNACLARGISDRTVDTAKKELGVKSIRRADGWYWAV
jgi:RecA/RadA recombinase